MIQANDIYLIEALKEEGVSERQIENVLIKLAGWSIYVRAKTVEKEMILNIYRQKRKAGLRNSEIVKQLAKIFNKSERRIREIVENARED